MFYMLRFLWNATRGHRLAPWRSPYLLWRVETYCGVKMQHIGFLEFWEFVLRERRHLWQFLRWTAQMELYAHPRRKNSYDWTKCEPRTAFPLRLESLHCCRKADIGSRLLHALAPTPTPPS